MGRHEAFNVTRLTGPRIYDRRDGIACQRSADWDGGSILDPAGFQWKRGNFLCAVWSAKRSDTQVELAGPRISRRVSSRGSVGSRGRLRCKMEDLILRTGLPAILDEPLRQRAFHNTGGFKLAFRRAIPVDPGCVSLRRTLNQIWRALPRARLYCVLSFRSHGAPEDSSVSISDGRRGALSILPAAVVDFGIYRIQLGLPDRGGSIDAVDHMVLPLFPRRRRTHVHDRR